MLDFLLPFTVHDLLISSRSFFLVLLLFLFIVVISSRGGYLACYIYLYFGVEVHLC